MRETSLLYFFISLFLFLICIHIICEFNYVVFFLNIFLVNFYLIYEPVRTQITKNGKFLLVWQISGTFGAAAGFSILDSIISIVFFYPRFISVLHLIITHLSTYLVFFLFLFVNPFTNHFELCMSSSDFGRLIIY